MEENTAAYYSRASRKQEKSCLDTDVSPISSPKEVMHKHRKLSRLAI